MADEFDLKPTSRGEEFLDVILRSLGGDTPDIPQPAWRYEEYLAAIANAIQNGGSGGGSSGGGVLYVTESQGMALDKNLVEIQAALDSGKVVMLTRESPSGDGVFYDPLIRIASIPEDPYYGVGFYDFILKQELSFGNTTGPTDPLVVYKD